jgi:TfoX/Sxy family transcriptional regulator of competence genes
MAYDEGVAQRIREALRDHPEVVERKMFGGLVFMVYGNMCCGALGEMLMVRVGPEQYKKALDQPHARKMDFTGKPLTGFVYVVPEGFDTDQAMAQWVRMSLDFVTALPPK